MLLPKNPYIYLVKNSGEKGLEQDDPSRMLFLSPLCPHLPSQLIIQPLL